MDEIILVFPTKEMENDAVDFVAEHFAHGEDHIHGSAGLYREASYDDWLAKLEAYQRGDRTMMEGTVPSTTYFAFLKNDSKIVGIIDIRHRLNEYLMDFGGHIGYGVRPTERRKGYATQMLALALKECRKLGLEKVLVTCGKKNLGSSGVIKKNGGVLENEMTEPDGDLLQRYWIDI